jgi:LytS/YehU family sensor histidine kinase
VVARQDANELAAAFFQQHLAPGHRFVLIFGGVETHNCLIGTIRHSCFCGYFGRNSHKMKLKSLIL